jgi:hypothetical protein
MGLEPYVYKNTCQHCENMEKVLQRALMTHKTRFCTQTKQQITFMSICSTHHETNSGALLRVLTFCIML